jgi:uncharacterized protein (TIGR03435 family)
MAKFNRQGRNMMTNFLRATVCVSAIANAAIFAALIPQVEAQDSARTIEAASIRPSSFPSESSFAGFAAAAGDVCNIGARRPLASGNRLTLGKITLCQLIVMGYGVQGFRVVDMPPPMRRLEASNYYDVQIKAEGEQPLTDDQSRALLRDLVKDRFHVTLHGDTRNLPVYVLAIGKNGTKLNETQVEGQTQRTGVPMTSYIAFMSRYVDRPIVDKTGLTGTHYQFMWNDKELREDLARDGIKPVPLIFHTVEEQLGLTLKAEKAPTEVLVIDHAEQPSQN